MAEQYLTYEEYRNMGGEKTEEAFLSTERKTRAVVDYRTFRRLSGETAIPQEVKNCMFQLIQLDEQEDAAFRGDGGGAVASQSNDGVSISYNTLSAEKQLEKIGEKRDFLLNLWLSGVQNSSGKLLLYRGVYPDE